MNAVPRPLDAVVAAAAAKLMAATVWTSVEISQQVLADLVTYFDLDAGFLRHNDHCIRASILITEWPPRAATPDPNPMAVVYFAELTDPVFVSQEHAKEAAVYRPHASIDDHHRLRIDATGDALAGSAATFPLVTEDLTTGTLGFVTFGDREWLPEELDALAAITSLFAQVQARIVAEEQLRHLADHDDLTGLHNRRWLLGHLFGRLRHREPVTVLFIDLDRLKNINDDLGHAAGDDVLCAAAQRLRAALRSDDVLARLGGDEFVVSLVTPISDSEIDSLAERIHAALAEPLYIADAQVCIGASIGVVVAEHHDPRDPLQILCDADAAMYAAKNTGRGRTHHVASRAAARDAHRPPTANTRSQPQAPGPDLPAHRTLVHRPASLSVIQQAIGILRSRSGDTAGEAFQQLDRMSHSHDVELAVVAQRIVDDAVRHAHPDSATSDGRSARTVD